VPESRGYFAAAECIFHVSPAVSPTYCRLEKKNPLFLSELLTL
jgi:hypothetical protein